MLAWIAKLLPKQKNEGSGAVQIGQAGGDVTTNSTSNVTIINLVTPAAAEAASPQPPPALTTVEQREVLAMIRKVPNREAVFLFMQKQFGTRMVIDLQPQQLLRLRRYVEAIHKNLEGPRKRATGEDHDAE
ncbi:hypothetical protein [Paracidovorax wautersii]|uniref:hypothetical protein n=1 Tax=Paracidovorax wautersii TaxID=1177982 RepID=UPI0031E3841F